MPRSSSGKRSHNPCWKPFCRIIILLYYLAFGRRYALEEQPASLCFSLSEVPPEDRRDTLREVFGRVLSNIDFVPLSEEPDFESVIQAFPGVTVSSGRYTPHVTHIGFDPSRGSDDLALVWGKSAKLGLVKHLGLEGWGGDGSAILISCAEPGMSENPCDFYPRTVRISRSMLLSLVPSAENALMRRIPAENPALRLLDTYIGVLRDAMPRSPEVRQAAALHICDLVALALGASRDSKELAAARGVRAARLAAVKQWVLARLGDPGLCIERAAAAQGVGIRYLQMLFEAEGTTFSAFVRSNRLALARRRLIDPVSAAHPISCAAYGSGFGDLSYFNRAFRAAYGETPSDFRHRMLSAQQ